MDEKDVREYCRRIDEVSRELDYQQKQVIKQIVEKLSSIQKTLNEMPSQEESSDGVKHVPGPEKHQESDGKKHIFIRESEEDPGEIVVEKVFVKYTIKDGSDSGQPDYFELS